MSEEGLAYPGEEQSDASAQEAKLYRESGCILSDLKYILFSFLSSSPAPTPCCPLPCLLPFLTLSLPVSHSSPNSPMNPGSASLLLEGCQSCDITTLWLPFKG